MSTKREITITLRVAAVTRDQAEAIALAIIEIGRMTHETLGVNASVQLDAGRVVRDEQAAPSSVAPRSVSGLN